MQWVLLPLIDALSHHRIVQGVHNHCSIAACGTGRQQRLCGAHVGDRARNFVFCKWWRLCGAGSVRGWVPGQWPQLAPLRPGFAHWRLVLWHCADADAILQLMLLQKGSDLHSPAALQVAADSVSKNCQVCAQTAGKLTPNVLQYNRPFNTLPTCNHGGAHLA